MLHFFGSELKRYPLSYAVMALSIASYFLLAIGGLNAVDALLMPPRSTQLASHEYGRLWTASLVHFSLGHLASNLLIWWFLARPIESSARIALLILCVFVPALSNYVEWKMAGPQFGGLSGLDYGLLAFLLLQKRFSGVRTASVDPVITVVMLVALPVAATGWFGAYANHTHLVGLLVGALVGLLYALLARTDSSIK